MKPPIKVEPMFAGDERRRIHPLVTLGLLAVVLASGVLALQAQSVDEQEGRRPPGPVRPPVAARTHDHFEVVAQADLDPKMVVKAPSELDAAMVIHPETGRSSGRASGRPSPGSRPSRGVRVPLSVPRPRSH